MLYISIFYDFYLLFITYLIDKKFLTRLQAVEKLTLGPAKILKLDKGTLKPGADADIIIVDPDKKWIVDASKLASRSKNTPFDGFELTGKVLHTMVAGKLVVKNAKLAV